MKHIYTLAALTCAIAIISACSPTKQVAQKACSKEAITLSTATGNIYSTAYLTGAKKSPVVLLIAGSGPTDRDGNQAQVKNNSLKLLAEGLCANGIAVVSYDKRGIAESHAAMTSERDLRFETYIDDARAWVDLLAQDKRFSHVIVAGHSEGSLIGMVACESNKKVSKYISIAGVGISADEILKEQLSSQPQQAKDAIFPMIDELKKGDTIPNVPMELMMLFRPSVQPYMISWFKYNPQAEIKKLNIPILIVQGTTDIQVSEKEAELLAKANSASKKVIIKNMNHVLKDCTSTEQESQLKTYTDPNIPLSEGLVKNVVGFIKVK